MEKLEAFAELHVELEAALLVCSNLAPDLCPQLRSDMERLGAEAEALASAQNKDWAALLRQARLIRHARRTLEEARRASGADSPDSPAELARLRAAALKEGGC